MKRSVRVGLLLAKMRCVIQGSKGDRTMRMMFKVESTILTILIQVGLGRVSMHNDID